MALRDAQRAISNWVQAPEGVAAALLEEDAASPGDSQGTASRRLEQLIRSDAILDAAGRLEIYANAYFRRIHGVLESDYPALSSAIGTHAFNDLVTSYLLVEPSRHPSLRYAGARLSRFLSSHEAAAGIRSRFVWASDLAALEWARVDVFDASDAAVLTRETLAARTPESFGSIHLRLGSWALRRRFEYSVDRIWASATRETLDPSSPDLLAEDTKGDVRLLIWRRDEAVLHRRIEKPEADALDLLDQGIEFEGLCEWAATEIGEDAAPALAAGWLDAWLSDAILADPL